jgi:SAM-dependent methyltransferase
LPTPCGGAGERGGTSCCGTGAGDPKTIREDVALRFLRGDGIEIGPLDYPLRLPREARVRYVDYLNGAGLREDYGNTLRAGRPLVVPDVVDDGARLASFADASLDFVVANHMLEHVEDPIAALEHQLRVLRPGGILYLTLPTLATHLTPRASEPRWSICCAITATAQRPRAARTMKNAPA